MEFFKNPVIQQLWMNYVQGDNFKDNLKEIPTRERTQLKKLLDRVSPAGFEVLP